MTKDAARSTFPRRRPPPSPGFSPRPMPAPTASSDTAPVSGDRYRPQPAQGWETDGLDPMTWQRARRCSNRKPAGRPTFVVTRAVSRQRLHAGDPARGEFVAAATRPSASPLPRHARPRTPARSSTCTSRSSTPSGTPRLGVDAWLQGLEELDADLRRFDASSPRVSAPRDGRPRHGRRPGSSAGAAADGDPLLHGVRLVAGSLECCSSTRRTAAARRRGAGVKPSSRARG
jgi:hypothetical protein